MNDHHNIKGNSILRQVFIVAALIIVIGYVLGHFVHEGFGFYLPLLVAAGLSFAGIVGICPMAYIIEKMPWNKNK